MQIFLFSLGILIFLAVSLDIVQTTLSLRGGGWLTTRYCYSVWSLLLKLSGRNGKSPILSRSGYLLLISVAFLWVLSLWLSFVLILASTEGSILNGTSKLPADLGEKIYYAGFTISTLGVGDFTASSNFWRIITSLYAFSGLILLTMSVTYLIPVLSAVMEQRKLGINISTYGTNPQDIIINSWNGNNFDRLFSQTPNLSDSLIMHSQNHRAYPVIQYFHNPDKENTIILQMARLYEALYIMKHFVKAEMRPTDFQISTLSVAFNNYLKVIKTATKTAIIEDVEPSLELSKLKEKGFVLPDVKVTELKDKFESDRKIFFTIMHRNGWKWKDVYEINDSKDYS